MSAIKNYIEEMDSQTAFDYMMMHGVSKELIYILIKEKNPKFLYLAAILLKNVDVDLLYYATLETGDINYITKFCRDIYGPDETVDTINSFSTFFISHIGNSASINYINISIFITIRKAFFNKKAIDIFTFISINFTTQCYYIKCHKFFLNSFSPSKNFSSLRYGLSYFTTWALEKSTLDTLTPPKSSLLS